MLPAVSLGCWQNFGERASASAPSRDEAEHHARCRGMLCTAFTLGVTHFDLANNYGPPPGAAESRVGRILREDFAGLRDELVISTKAGYTMWPGPYGDWGSRKYLIASCDQSLKRLGLEYVDIFYSHRPDPETPVEETMGALDHLVRSGKALYAGLSNYSPAQTREALRVCEERGFVKPVIHQPKYNLIDQRMETEGLFEMLAEAGMGSICFSPLQGGLLTGKYLDGVAEDSRKGLKGNEDQDPWLHGEKRDRLARLKALAEARGLTCTQLALLWTLRPGRCTSALIGASRPDQIVEACSLLKRTPVDAITESNDFAAWSQTLREQAAKYTTKVSNSSAEIVEGLREERG